MFKSDLNQQLNDKNKRPRDCAIILIQTPTWYSVSLINEHQFRVVVQLQEKSRAFSLLILQHMRTHHILLAKIYECFFFI